MLLRDIAVSTQTLVSPFVLCCVLGTICLRIYSSGFPRVWDGMYRSDSRAFPILDPLGMIQVLVSLRGLLAPS